MNSNESQLIRDLPNIYLDQMIKIESTNMIPILYEIGISINKNDIADQFTKNYDSVVIFTLKNNSISSFVIYRHEVSCIFISSIQIDFTIVSSLVLGKLLRKCFISLKKENHELVESLVQKSNTKSIELHLKLGFRNIKENDKSIRFSTFRLDLLDRVSSAFL